MEVLLSYISASVKVIQYGESMRKADRQQEILDKHKGLLKALQLKQNNGAFLQTQMREALGIINTKKGFNLSGTQLESFKEP